jgi:hypothetical protein
MVGMAGEKEITKAAFRVQLPQEKGHIQTSGPMEQHTFIRDEFGCPLTFEAKGELTSPLPASWFV